MKKVIKVPSDLTVDSVIYGIAGNDIRPNIPLKEYSSIPMLVMGVALSEEDVNVIEVRVLNNGKFEDIKFPNKNHHSPKEKEGEIFLNEEDALKTIKNLTNKTHEDATEIMKVVGAMKEFWDKKTTIAPNSDEESKTYNISRKKSKTVFEIEETEEVNED